MAHSRTLAIHTSSGVADRCADARADTEPGRTWNRQEPLPHRFRGIGVSIVVVTSTSGTVGNIPGRGPLLSN